MVQFNSLTSWQCCHIIALSKKRITAKCSMSIKSNQFNRIESESNFYLHSILSQSLANDMTSLFFFFFLKHWRLWLSTLLHSFERLTSHSPSDPSNHLNRSNSDYVSRIIRWPPVQHWHLLPLRCRIFSFVLFHLVSLVHIRRWSYTHSPFSWLIKETNANSFVSIFINSHKCRIQCVVVACLFVSQA